MRLSILSRLRLFAHVALLGSASVGCTDAQEGPGHVPLSGGDVITGDNAGWRQEEAWRLSDSPMLRFGQEDGPDELRFSRIRRILTLPNSHILVVDGGGAPGLRIFNSSGQPVSSFGGRGNGPGEFVSLFDAWFVEPDTIVTFDSRQARVSWFLTDGTLVRDELVARLTADRMVVRGRYDDGTWLLVANAPLMQDGPEGRVSLRMLSRGAADGEGSDSIGYFEEATHARRPITSGRPVLMPGIGTYVAVGARLYAGYPNPFEIQVRAPNGTLLHTVRRTVDVTPLDDRLFDRLAAERIAAADDRARRSLRISLAMDPRPQTLPGFSGVLAVDAEMNLWVQSFVIPGSETVSWKVFDESGSYRGAVEVPIAFTPHEIREGHMLGVWRDELDVETVRGYGLIR